MSPRPPKFDGLREDLPPTISATTHPHAIRRTVCVHIGKRRNLVLNLDGTANQFSEHSTNVVELFSRLIKDEDQLVYYDSGIGTYAPPSFRSLSYIKQVIDHAIDTAIAWNFEKIVHAAYKWLSENYQPGDRIFLFGFSRGAYQARVIAGMIETVGLLHKGNERQIPFAYELYASVMDSNKRSGPENTKTPDASIIGATRGPEKISKSEAKRRKQTNLCLQFKKSLCHKDVKVHFVGAWDTVSSIGVLRGKSLPETVSGMGHVCHFRHALALDECRVKFQPEYANGGLGQREGDTGDVKEVWFAGSHSDIGGGNISNEDLKNFGPALRWMTYEAMALGLRIDPFEGSWRPLRLTKSLTSIWRVFEIFPFPSLTYRDANSTSLRPHLCAGRKVQQGQLIHQSVFLKEPTSSSTSGSDSSTSDSTTPRRFRRCQTGYFPKASLPDSSSYTWATLLSTDPIPLDIAEKDPFQNASHAVKVVENICRNANAVASLDTLQLTLSTLRTFAGDETRLASLLEVPDLGMILIKLLRFAMENPSVMIEQEFMETLIRLLSLTRVAWEQLPNTLDPPIPPIKLYEWGSQVQPDYQDDLLRVIQVFACLGKQRHSQWIYDIAISRSNPKQITFASRCHHNSYASIWNGSRQPPNDLVEIHALQERSLAVSHDGSHIAVGDGNDITSIGIIAEPHFEVKGTNAGERREPIYSLRFSEDLQTLASRHDDGWIKIWRRQRDQWRISKRCRGKGLGLPPYDLAFSKDGSRLAFWSLKGLRVWNLADDSLIALEESQELPCSLSWVPSGESIITGTMYGRVKIWSVNQRKTIHTFKAHRNRIECLALRHDGKLLATGGYDERIRVWKFSNWEKIWDFNIGERVSSLAFSPDGKRLVSGGAKGALHLWNVDIGDNEGMEYSLIE